MENVCGFHGKAPNSEQGTQALKELENGNTCSTEVYND